MVERSLVVVECFVDGNERQLNVVTWKDKCIEFDEGCLTSCKFQVLDGPLMETYMVQVKVT